MTNMKTCQLTFKRDRSATNEEEIKRARLKVPHRKASGSDNIAIELLGFGVQVTLNKLYLICIEVRQSGSRPEEWSLCH